MHILHIALGGCLRAPPVIYGITPDTGGHIAYVIEAARAQAADPSVDHVTILTRRFKNETLGLIHDQPTERISNKITIIRLGPPSSPYLEKDAANAIIPDLIDYLLVYAKRPDVRFDIIHAHFADAALLGLALSEVTGTPVIYTPHALGIDKLRAGGRDTGSLRYRISLEQNALKHAHGIIVSTRDEAERQIPRYSVENRSCAIRVIPPGAPSLDQAPASHGRVFLESHLKSPDRPFILAIARPVAKKNLAFLAQTYAMSPTLQKAANLVILAGQHQTLIRGSEEYDVVHSLENIRAINKLQERFALPDKHCARDIAGLYRHAAETGSIFVNPARHEPFGLTLLEAASVGLPVIATDCGGPVDILARIGHGILVSPDNATAFEQAMIRLLGTPELRRRLSRAAMQHGMDFNWPDYASESVRFYRMILSRNNTASIPCINLQTAAFSQMHTSIEVRP